MAQELGQHIESITHSVKATSVISTATASIGLGTLFEFLPSVLGSLATIAGIVLSSIMIYKIWLETRKLKLEVKGIKAKNLAEKNARIAKGEPVRRKEDR